MIDPRCDYCGIVTSEDVPENHPQRATVEDIVPLSKGGRNSRSNWALACACCNQAKGAEHVEPKRSPPVIRRLAVKMGQPFTVMPQYRMTEAERRARKHFKRDRKDKEEIERLARLAKMPFSFYTPIPGVPDEAFR